MIKSSTSSSNTSTLLKVQSYKLCYSKYIIASMQIKSTEVFAFLTVLVFKLLRRKDVFINRKDKRNC